MKKSTASDQRSALSGQLSAGPAACCSLNAESTSARYLWQRKGQLRLRSEANTVVLFVSDGVSQGRWYGTFFEKANGRLRRFVSAKLPLRVGDRQAAQRDLDAFAKAKGLSRIV